MHAKQETTVVYSGLDRIPSCLELAGALVLEGKWAGIGAEIEKRQMHKSCCLLGAQLRHAAAAGWGGEERGAPHVPACS